MQPDKQPTRSQETIRSEEGALGAAGDPWNRFLKADRSDANGPHSAATLTVAQFVASRFVPEHVAAKTTPGRRHYHAILKYIVPPAEVDRMFSTDDSAPDSRLKNDPAWPYVGDVLLDNVSSDHVQQIISAAVRKGYSAQTITHIRNVIRVIFTHAAKVNVFFGDNPANGVSVPEMHRRESHSLSLDQMLQLLKRMQYPEREVALIAILTNMTIAEICGLKWICVNLSDYMLVREGISIPPRSIAVRNRWYRGELSRVPERSSKDISMSPLLLRILRTLSQSRNCGWSDFVLSSKTGRPINQVNLAARRLKRIGKQLDIPWFSWQVLRRSRLTLFHEYEARVQDQLSRVVFPATAIHAFTRSSTR
jgi:integrase